MVDSVLTLNPGQLSKKKAAGTYASMVLQAREVTDEEREGQEESERVPNTTHNIFDRARVDVLRI